MSKRLDLVITLFCCLPPCLAGCGGGRPELVAVEGAVTLDGDPLAGAQVMFQVADPDSEYRRPSVGVTDAEGKFTIGTYGADDGLPVGSYKVGIIKRELIGELPDDYNSEDPSASSQPIRYQWTTPRAYSTPEDSGLTAEVTSEGITPPVFELESGGSPPEIETVGAGQSGAGEP